MNRWLTALACGMVAPVLYAQNVSKPPAEPPRFPKAMKELQQQTKPPSGNWLLDANDDTERFRRLQVISGGTETSMLEIAHRFETVHLAISKNNWRLATQNWDKIRDRLNAAAMKRPARTKNLEEKYFDSGVWQALHDALRERDADKSRAAFQNARKTCMGCHEAERVGFQNDNLVFSRTESFPPASK